MTQLELFQFQNSELKAAIFLYIKQNKKQTT
jgi:hypothetical protein